MVVLGLLRISRKQQTFFKSNKGELGAKAFSEPRYLVHPSEVHWICGKGVEKSARQTKADEESIEGLEV